jgi:hypothetical protein
MRRITTAIVAATIGLSAGCTASPTASPEPVSPLTTECWTLRTPLEKLDAALTDAMAALYDDPAESATVLARGALPFTDATSVIKDAQLREAAEPVGDAMNRLAEAMTAYGTDPSEQNAATVLDINDEITDQVALVGEICGEA